LGSRKYITGFLLSGIIANFISSFLFYIQSYILEISPFFSAIIAQLFALICSYLFNSRITFDKKLSNYGKLCYFSYYLITIYTVAFAIANLTTIGIPKLLSWFICVLLAAICNYLVVKKLLFKVK
tara:strand:+ start:6729 stop:7103 length:375 start_codon:yes stop_codon:yes gene_type:complete